MRRCPQCMRNAPADAFKCPSCGMTFATNQELHDETEPGIATPAGTLIDSQRAETVASTHLGDTQHPQTHHESHATHQESDSTAGGDDVFTNERPEESTLSAVDARILREIDGKKSIDDIARITGIRKIAIERSIEQLVERGLVVVDADVPRGAHVVTVIDPPKIDE